MSSVSVSVDRAAVGAPVLELLEWVARAPRTYRETMEAWRSHCPRLTVWEDAVADGLVRIEQTRTPIRRSVVVLTPRGHEAVAGTGRTAS